MQAMLVATAQQGGSPGRRGLCWCMAVRDDVWPSVTAGVVVHCRGGAYADFGEIGG